MDVSLLGTDVILPSKGLPYKGAIPDGKVHVSPFTSAEEMILTGVKPGMALQALDIVMSRCCPAIVSDGMKPEDLVQGDRIYLLNVIRAVSLGTEYVFTVQCSSCEFSFKHSVNTPDDFEVFYLPDDFKEPFFVDLPASKAKIGLRLFRISDENAVVKYTEKLYQKLNGQKVIGDLGYSYRIARAVETITNSEGKVFENKTPDDLNKVKLFIDKLIAMDTRAIREAMINNDCGMNLTMEVECPKCTVSMETQMPYGPDFLRPTTDRRSAGSRSVE